MSAGGSADGAAAGAVVISFRYRWRITRYLLIRIFRRRCWPSCCRSRSSMCYRLGIRCYS